MYISSNGRSSGPSQAAPNLNRSGMSGLFLPQGFFWTWPVKGPAHPYLARLGQARPPILPPPPHIAKLATSPTEGGSIPSPIAILSPVKQQRMNHRLPVARTSIVCRTNQPLHELAPSRHTRTTAGCGPKGH
ncbi:hypothetical protein LWI28_016508 [Acer negundo]|uniref:Uncharacterized protein n=1 Tax=Acer negundo TaxID=4023 RepID=A0AAD5JEI4_ACENE|nr:hypothetical protein LWI28_016508 [Acer negundo]